MSTEILLSLLPLCVLDRIVGDPDWLWRRLPHPVVLFGKAIGCCDRAFNRKRLGDETLKVGGILVIAALLVVQRARSAGCCIGCSLRSGPFGVALETVLVAVFLAQKSLADHVARVADGLRSGGLEGGRKAVSMIVGRDPETLDGPASAAPRSKAWPRTSPTASSRLPSGMPLFGLPGLLAYKMLNTADSMIGHKSAEISLFRLGIGPPR